MLEEVHFLIFRSCTAKVLRQKSVPFPLVTQTPRTSLLHNRVHQKDSSPFRTFTMAGIQDPFSSPLFVPQDSPTFGVGSDNHHLDMPFDELDLGMLLEAPDVDMDHTYALEDIGNPEPKPVNIGRSIFRLPAAGHTHLVGTQQSQPQSQPQESVALEQSEDAEMREEPTVGGDVSFASPSTLSPLAAFDFDFDAHVFSFGESHTNTEVGLPGQDLFVAQSDEDLSVAQPHGIREEELEFFPSFATDVGQPEFNFGQPDPHTDCATEVNQHQLNIDQQSRDAEREVRQEAPFSAQYPLGSQLPSLQPLPEDQAAPAPLFEHEQVNTALLPSSPQTPFDVPSLKSESPAPVLVVQRETNDSTLSPSRSQTPSDFPSLKSEGEDKPAPAPAIDRAPTNSVLSPSSSRNLSNLPALQPKFEEQATPAPTIECEPASATISPFTSRAERALRAKLKAIKSEEADQERATVDSMALPQTASARRTRSGAAKEDTEMKEAILLSSKANGSGTAKENTKKKEATLLSSEATGSGTAREKKEATLLSSDAFNQAARRRERSGTPFGIQPSGNSATNSTSTSTDAMTAIDNAFNALVSPDGVRVPDAVVPSRAQRRQIERDQRREDKRSNNGNNLNMPSTSISQPTNNPIPIFSNPTASPPPIPSTTAATPEALINAAHKHLDSQARLYRSLENDACDREEELAECWTLARQLRVKAIEERRNALVVIRHRRRQLATLQGLSAGELFDGGLMDLMRPMHVEKEPQVGTEEFEKMVIEGQEAGEEDDGYETPPFGVSG
jgi:hypothetical protein